jgi:lipase ATG15
MGYMAWNSYFDPESDNWAAIPGWNNTDGFGWVEDGIRGYVFSTYDPDGKNYKDGHDRDEIIAISIKGTSPNAFGIGGPTSSRDKFNDNMMFSCCCGRVDRTWFPICDCYRGNSYPSTKRCSSSCLQDTCRDWDDAYYRMAEEIYLHVRSLYPKASIWLVGHSLGGVLASVTAQRFHIPAVAFEAPGDALFAGRIGIVPDSKSTDPRVVAEWERVMHESLVLHVGNSGDPIFLGVCNGPYSSCYFSGYALESKCHLGRECLYNLDHIGDPDPGDGNDNSRPPDDGKGDCHKKWYWPFPCKTKVKNQMVTSAKFSKDISTQASLSLNKHRMRYMLFDVMMAWKSAIPTCELDKKCEDCQEWEFVKD